MPKIKNLPWTLDRFHPFFKFLKCLCFVLDSTAHFLKSFGPNFSYLDEIICSKIVLKITWCFRKTTLRFNFLVFVHINSCMPSCLYELGHKFNKWCDRCTHSLIFSSWPPKNFKYNHCCCLCLIASVIIRNGT